MNFFKSCAGSIYETLFLENEPPPLATNDPQEVGKLLGRQFKCRLCGTVLLIAASVAAVVGILFVSQTFGYSSIMYFYGGTCFAGSLFLFLLAAIGLMGNHAQPFVKSPPSDKK